MAHRSKPDLERENQALKREIDQLRADIKELQQELVRRAMEEVPAAPAQELLDRVLAALRTLDGYHPGEPIAMPVLRREARLPRENFDQALLELERQGRVVLQAVQFPQLVDAECGVPVSDRGLLYYVRAR